MKMFRPWALSPQVGVAAPVRARNLCRCHGSLAGRKKRNGSFGGKEVDHIWVVEEGRVGSVGRTLSRCDPRKMELGRIFGNVYLSSCC